MYRFIISVISVMFDQVLKKKKDIIAYLKSLWIPTNKIHNEELMMLAFVHKSYAADFKDIFTHNERLEFVGDGILGAIINKLLFINHQQMAESDLTLYKIALVREEILAEIAKDIKLNDIVFISKGEEKMQGRQKDSILSDALEALIGYLYIDLGVNITEQFIEKYIYTKLERIEKNPVKSYKTMSTNTSATNRFNSSLSALLRWRPVLTLDVKPTLSKAMRAKQYVLHGVFRTFLYLQWLVEPNMLMAVWSAQFQ